MRALFKLAWQDLRGSGHSLWVLCACLALGVTLIAATGGLYRQVSEGLLADSRELSGGDLQVHARAPLPEPVLQWMNATGIVSLVTELDTMMGTMAGAFQLVELQSVDDNYPLYGELTLSPNLPLSTVTGKGKGNENGNGLWGIAVDPVFGQRLAITPGDRVEIGQLEFEVRAFITQQPDRSLSANWRGAPVMIAADGLKASGLLLPSSRIDYEYRVRTSQTPDAWQSDFFAAFPNSEWEVRSFLDQSDRIAERLSQVASGLLIIGFSTLFIGGLGVYNSVQAYLQGKLGTIATLRAVGLRDNRLAAVYLLQILIMSGLSCLVGALLGFFIALAGAALTATQVQVETAVLSAVLPCLIAFVFGILTALTFSFPAIGRALSVNPAALFRALDGVETQTPAAWWRATAVGVLLIVGLVLLVLPDGLFALAFTGAVAGLLLLLEGIVRLIRRGALRLDQRPGVRRHFALHLAMANLHRHGSALRASLLTLGSALTLLVACTIVVATLIDTIANTIPDESPTLILYDIADYQQPEIVETLQNEGASRIDIAPLVQGRLATVNGESLSASSNIERQREARDEHKLTYRSGNIDGVAMVQGKWWDEDLQGTAAVVMEDREADQLGLRVGDQLVFDIEGRPLEAVMTGIYRQKGLQTRFWFEAIFSDGALDPFISRYVGAGYMSAEQAISAQTVIAQNSPNVVTVRTATLLATAEDLLGKAMAGLALVAAVALTVSLLVLTGVMATNRSRQVYYSTILHALGTRLSVIRQSLNMEYLLLALVTSVFSLVLGTLIAVPLLVFQLKLPLEFPVWPALITAFGVSAVCLSLGARYLMRRLTLQPAILLRGN